MRFIFIFLSLFFTSTVHLNAQKNTYLNQKYWGIFVQYGIAYYDLPEQQRYQPLLIGAIHHLPIYQTKNAFNVGVNIMPQIGLVRYNNRLNIEFGANVQFDANLALAEKHILSFRAGAGPHFVNVRTRRQAKGFIFSDNFAFAYRTKLKDTQQLGITAGWRHLSNAGLMQPNSGLDNIMLGFEFARWY
ncbi:MAG: acyloxyacyl hydrolase [Bacteroidota bacterium]